MTHTCRNNSVLRLQTLVIITWIVHYIQGLCMFGDITAGCVFPCFCTSSCHRTTGNCLNGGECQLDQPSASGIRRTGAGCRIGNVALAKPAFQNGQWENLDAGLAVDGIITTDMRRCAHTDAGYGNRALWYVDLHDSYTVVSVTIFNQKNPYAHRRTGNFRLGVGNVTDGDQTSLCREYTGIVPDGGHSTIHCDSPVTGQYVTIIRKGGFNPGLLCLCEVMVHGYKPIVCDRNRCPTCSPINGCEYFTPGYKYTDGKTEAVTSPYGQATILGPVAGSVAGFLLLLLVAAIFIVAFIRRRTKKHHRRQPGQYDSVDPVPPSPRGVAFTDGHEYETLFAQPALSGNLIGNSDPVYEYIHSVGEPNA